MQIKDLIESLRINNWIKNLIVFFPLFISIRIFNIELFLKVSALFAVFCFISSAVYILNDLVDIKNDSLHPIKKFRPIAKGLINKKQALLLIFIFCSFSFLLSFFLNKNLFFLVLSYFVLNIFYSFIFKNIPILDVVFIAFGFIIRILAACVLVCCKPSLFLLLLVFFLCIFFTFSKRKFEFYLNKENKLRKSIKFLNLKTISFFIFFGAILSILFYFIYIFYLKIKILFLTCLPFCLIVFRLYYLFNIKKIENDPLVYVLNDKILKILFLFYLFAVFISFITTKII